MCADALDSNSANEINDSLFGSHKIPTDPFPSDTSLTGASCTFASNGYLYVLPYMNNDAVKVNRTYILEVGLENTDVTSEAQFTSFTSAGLTSPNTYRNYYVLYGPAVPAS